MDVFTPVYNPVVQQSQSAVQFELERCLAREQAITGSGTIYTAPLSTTIETATDIPNRTVVTKVSVNCVTCTCNLHVVPSGGSADTSNLVWAASFAAPSSAKTSLGYFVDLTHVYMEPGDTLQVTSLSSPAYFFVHGKEYF